MDHTAALRVAMARMHEPWGGALCLDFANTLEPRGGPPPITVPAGFPIRDELTSYLDLVAWAVHKDALPVAAGESLVTLANDHPAPAATVLRRAHALRDAIYRAVWGIANQRQPASADLAVIAAEYAAGAAHAVLAPAAGGLRWQWPDPGPDRATNPKLDLARPLWPVAWSAADLLTTGDPARLKVCPGAPGRPVRCGWLFYDATKNRSRRWCNMMDCGDETKAKRQTARRRASRAAAAATGAL